MLGDSAVLGAGGGSGGGEGGVSVDAVGGVTHEGAVVASGGGGGVGSNSGDDERGRIDEGERSFGGNRWPRQETLALLRIRKDMDVAFRDASVKGPLWEEVSRCVTTPTQLNYINLSFYYIYHLFLLFFLVCIFSFNSSLHFFTSIHVSFSVPGFSFFFKRD